MFRSGLLLRHDSSSSSSSETEPGEAAAEAPAVQQDTLLVYIYNEDDPVFRDNFQHFLLAGVQPGSRCRCALSMAWAGKAYAAWHDTSSDGRFALSAGRCAARQQMQVRMQQMQVQHNGGQHVCNNELLHEVSQALPGSRCRYAFSRLERAVWQERKAGFFMR
jgi:hypothetical protein